VHGLKNLLGHLGEFFAENRFVVVEVLSEKALVHDLIAVIEIFTQQLLGIFNVK